MIIQCRKQNNIVLFSCLHSFCGERDLDTFFILKFNLFFPVIASKESSWYSAPPLFFLQEFSFLLYRRPVHAMKSLHHPWDSITKLVHEASQWNTRDVHSSSVLKTACLYLHSFYITLSSRLVPIQVPWAGNIYPCTRFDAWDRSAVHYFPCTSVIT